MWKEKIVGLYCVCEDSRLRINGQKKKVHEKFGPNLEKWKRLKREKKNRWLNNHRHVKKEYVRKIHGKWF